MFVRFLISPLACFHIEYSSCRNYRATKNDRSQRGLVQTLVVVFYFMLTSFSKLNKFGNFFLLLNLEIDCILHIAFASTKLNSKTTFATVVSMICCQVTGFSMICSQLTGIYTIGTVVNGLKEKGSGPHTSPGT